MNDKVEFTDGKMLGEMVSSAVNVAKEMSAMWPVMQQEEQQKIVARFSDVFEPLIHRLADSLGSHGHKYCIGTVDSVTFKEGVKVVVKVSRTADARHDLADHEGQTVLLVMTDAEKYMGGASDVETDPDNRELDLGGGKEADPGGHDPEYNK